VALYSRKRNGLQQHACWHRCCKLVAAVAWPCASMLWSRGVVLAAERYEQDSIDIGTSAGKEEGESALNQAQASLLDMGEGTDGSATPLAASAAGGASSSGGALADLMSFGGGGGSSSVAAQAAPQSAVDLLGDLMGGGGSSASSGFWRLR
jgi:hypothetical protein